ncbi:PEPxxWA-CTERM sorting domain-containing protein [Sandarakinorhabdus oryzae]|uniref:PEPxxWA-CTERM sorting domain-containing protein n=1 Tax=Sandarakinorhabdus oryzae TaxID=2675220 RepID=UPI001F2228B9|nr:PEPxxWA-CTERM sorting domain-containing protein [Sandarakinorhabdus oryzae]
MRRFLIAASVLAAATSASGTVTTLSGSFTATDWSVYFGTPAPPPITPLFLSYSVTFDDALTYNNDANPLTIVSTNIPYPIKFSFQANGTGYILASSGDPSSCTHFPNTFCAFFSTSAPSNPNFVEQSGDTGGWRANTITPGIGAVPEPASWAMLIAGFGLVGAVSRRRRGAVAA